MKQNNVIAYLRQLCCSGLSKEIVISEFLRTLPALIPSHHNTFSGTDAGLYPQYHIAGFDLAGMRATIPAIVASFHTQARQQRAIDWFRDHPAITDARVIEPKFYGSELYDLVYRPFDMHHVLWMPVTRGGRPLGVLGLYRTKTQVPFGNAEQTLLGHVLQYVAHALANGACREPQYSENGRTGMMILNRNGQVLSQSREAEQLLGLARLPRLLVDGRREDRLLNRLSTLCANLTAVHRGQSAPPPEFSHINPYGRFRFHAYRLFACQDQNPELIGVTIEHQEPVALKILRAMQGLSLSPMQQEVAQYVAEGWSFDNIAKRLHIKPTTVKDHVGKIYTKLDIGQREELLPKLLAKAG